LVGITLRGIRGYATDTVLQGEIHLAPNKEY